MQKGARAVIVKDGKILLGKREKHDEFYGLWCTFGGSLEAEEKPEQALARELLEELGIEIKNPEPLTVVETVDGDIHYFLVREWEGTVTNADASDEHSEVRWFSLDELRDLPMGWIGRLVIKNHMEKLFEHTPKKETERK